MSNSSRSTNFFTPTNYYTISSNYHTPSPNQSNQNPRMPLVQRCRLAVTCLPPGSVSNLEKTWFLSPLPTFPFTLSPLSRSNLSYLGTINPTIQPSNSILLYPTRITTITPQLYPTFWPLAFSHCFIHLYLLMLKNVRHTISKSFVNNYE